jgi:hypothetical protein
MVTTIIFSCQDFMIVALDLLSGLAEGLNANIGTRPF